MADYEIIAWVTKEGAGFRAHVRAMPAQGSRAAGEHLDRVYGTEDEAMHGVLVISEMLKLNITGRGDHVSSLRIAKEAPADF